MYHDGWIKYMAHLVSMCFSSVLNTQVLFYDARNSHFDYSSFNILWSNHIHSFILESGYSVRNHSNHKVPNLNLNNLHVYSRINWMRKHGNLKFIPDHMNDVLF